MMSRWYSLLPLILVACGPTARNTEAARQPAPGSAAAEAAAVAEVTVGPNPFVGAEMFRNPGYVAKVEAAAKADPANAALLEKVKAHPTAIWLDTIASISQLDQLLPLAEEQAKAGKPVVVSVVVYNLPNRDCSAKASAGELDVAAGGEARYKTEFIDKIAAAFAAHPNLRIAAVLEPDSLANMATNLNVPKCAASDNVYRDSTAYAIQKLDMPHVSLYLDAAHAGWLGWEGNRPRIAKIFKDVLTRAGGVDKIRGFATNVSNYNTVSGQDGKKLGPANPCPDEATYVAKLSEALEAEGVRGKRFVIDTARNGRVVRSTWGHWCNIKGAGMGPRPVADPMPLVDAFLWIKPPGESDGTSDPKAARFDQGCASPDSMPDAPEAGQWFGIHFLEMAKNAEPAL